MKAIYFTGSSGSGKTTTSELVAHRTGLKIFDGITRSSPFKMGTDENQQYVSRKIYSTCMSRLGVHCRTPLDVYAYTQAFGLRSPADEQHVKFFAKTNPFLVHFPVLGQIEDDGFRPTDREFNLQVDEHIRFMIKRYNFNCLYLQSDSSPEERAGEIITHYRRTYEQEVSSSRLIF